MAIDNNLLVRGAELLGTAINRFRKARDSGLTTKPTFVTGLAQESEGQATQFEHEAAQRRAVQNSWFFAGVQTKSLDLSQAKMDVYLNPSGLQGEGEPAVGHPFLNLLRRPNPYMSFALLIQYLSWWLDLSGEGFIFLEPGNGGLKGLWPLPSNKMDIEFTADKKDIKSYILKLTQWYYINPKYIIFIRYANPFDFFRGLAPLVASMLSVDSDGAMKTWNRNFFSEDNVMPSAVISLGSGDPQNAIEQSDIDNVTEQLKSEYGAIHRKTVVTNANNMAVQLLGYSAKEMDFLSGMQWNKEEILIGLGVPPGILDKNATEANAIAGMGLFKDNMWGVKSMVADAFTQALKLWYHEDLEARYLDDRTRERSLKLAESVQAMNVMTMTEVRQTYWNLPPLKPGEVPANKDTFGAVDPLTGLPAGPSGAAPADDGDGADDEADPKDTATDKAKATAPAEGNPEKLKEKPKAEAVKKSLSIDLATLGRRAARYLKAHKLERLTYVPAALSEDTVARILSELKTATDITTLNTMLKKWEDLLDE